MARARERSPTAVAAWLERHYPAIAKRAKAEGAAIYWGDETGISNQDQIGRSYAPKGRRPWSSAPHGGLSNRGLMRFMFYAGAPNADRFIAFLRRLTKDAGQKVFLIVDNLKVHHAARVKTWVAAHGRGSRCSTCTRQSHRPRAGPSLRRMTSSSSCGSGPSPTSAKTN